MGCECALIAQISTDIETASSLHTKAAQISAEAEGTFGPCITSIQSSCHCVSPDNLDKLLQKIEEMDDKVLTELGWINASCTSYKAYLEVERESAKQRDNAHHQAEAAAAAANANANTQGNNKPKR